MYSSSAIIKATAVQTGTVLNYGGQLEAVVYIETKGKWLKFVNKHGDTISTRTSDEIRVWRK